MKKLKQMVSEDNLSISRRSTKSSTVERQYSTEPIPVDLLIDIFLRVPSKSIARFCCVSKLWANILGRPYFTELFLRKSLNHPRLLFAFLVNGKLDFFSCPQNTEANSCLVATRYRTNSYKTSFNTSVHGMVCRQYWIKYYPQTKPVMCNPITGEFLALPKVKTHDTSCPKLYCVYDPTNKQYKLLCVSNYSSRAQVLTLNTGKHLWRMIKCTPHHSILCRGISIGGVLYYLALITGDYMIVCFDARSEKLSFIRVNDTKLASKLINFKGKLGEVHFTDSDRTSLRLCLVEQDHAGKYKWSSNIYELPLSFRGFYIVGMTAGTSDIVLSPEYLSEDPFYVFYYNVERKALRRVEIKGFKIFSG